MPIAYSHPKLHVLCHIQEDLESILDTKGHYVAYHSTDVYHCQSLRSVSKSSRTQYDEPVLKAERRCRQQNFSISRLKQDLTNRVCFAKREKLGVLLDLTLAVLTVTWPNTQFNFQQILKVLSQNKLKHQIKASNKI